MRIALLTSFAASRKEPLAAVVTRIHQAFHDAGLGQPAVRFNFGDAPAIQVLPGFHHVSSVDRVLKRHPELERFVTSADPMPGIAGTRRISNGPMSAGAGETVPFATVEAIAAGVPRSFPFHNVLIHFFSPEFGEMGPLAMMSAEMMPGILVTDSWWVNGRNRSVSACRVIEADADARKLPPPAGALAAVLAACGKARRTVQAPLVDKVPTAPVPAVRLPTGTAMPSVNPQVAQAVRAVVLDYRARMGEIVDRAALPHSLPPGPEALRDAGSGVTAGPMKPALERAFKPLGYSCRGGSGSFTLRRRTAANLTAELHLDVGRWGGSVLAIYHVYGVGFKATLFPPVAANAMPMAQYPVGDAARWQKIVENLAALVAELDRSFVSAVEAVAGPSPEWYSPES